MFEYKASERIRLEIIESAVTLLFDSSDRQDLRVELVRRLREKIHDARFDDDRRHGIQRAIEHIITQYGIE